MLDGMGHCVADTTAAHAKEAGRKESLKQQHEILWLSRSLIQLEGDGCRFGDTLFVHCPLLQWTISLYKHKIHQSKQPNFKEEFWATQQLVKDRRKSYRKFNLRTPTLSKFMSTAQWNQTRCMSNMHRLRRGSATLRHAHLCNWSPRLGNSPWGCEN